MEKIAEFFIRLFLNLPCLPVFAETMHERAVEWAVERIKGVISSLAGLGGCMKDIMSMSSSSDDVFGGGDFAATINASVEGVVTSGIEALAGLGITIAIIMWIVSIVELAMQDRLTPEMLIKSLAKLVFAASLCDIASILYSGIVEFGDSLGTDIANVFGGLGLEGFTGDTLPSDTEANLRAALDESNWVTIYIDVATMLLPIYFAQLVMMAIAYVIQFTRIIELNVRAIFLPIAFGMLADDGWRGAGGRYIRKFTAICAQGAVLICIGCMTSSIMSAALLAVIGNLNDLTALSNGLVMVLGVGIAMMAVMFKSIGIVNDVFGG